jgi:hypothetical protein
MSAIVKANAHLTNGGLSVLKRSFTTSDDGLMTYFVEYVCLSKHASKWTPFFKTKAQPPTALPANMLLLTLNKTPELFDLQTETFNGLSYFRATYSAGVATEAIITESSEQRSISWPITYPIGYNITVPFSIDYDTAFVTTGTETITASFDYISFSVTAQSKNSELPAVKGSVGQIFNYVGPTDLSLPWGVSAGTIETTSKTRNNRGEYTYSKTSTGVYRSGPVEGPAQNINNRR